MSRKELLRILQRRCAELGVDGALPHAGARPRRSCGRRPTSWSPPTAPTPGTRAAAADVFGPSVETGRSRYMWLGTDLVFEAFTFDVRETPHGVVQLHGYPYDARRQHVIVEMHERVWERMFADVAALDLRPGESDEKSIAMVRALYADLLDGHELLANNSRWLRFPTVRQRDLARTATSSCSATPRTPRTSRSARAPSSRWRTRWRWRRACTSSRIVPAALAGLRGGAAAGRALHPARGPGQPGVVRGHRPLRAPGPDAVRVQHRHPQPPRHPRQPAGARPGVRRDGRRVVRPGSARSGRRCSSRSGSAGWSCTTGSSSRRWTCTRARRRRARPTSTSSTWAARRSAGPGWS